MAKKSTAAENVSAAYDRMKMNGNAIVADTSVLWARITELEAENEEIHLSAQEKLSAIVKEYDTFKAKTRKEIANLQAQVDNYSSHFGNIVKAIQTPVGRKVQYTPDAED